MGYQFESRFANFIGYLSGEVILAPRASERFVWEFFQSLSDSYSLRERIVTNGENKYGGQDGFPFREAPSRLISSDGWADKLASLSAELSNKIERYGEEDQLLTSEQVGFLLNPLKPFFRGYGLYGMFFSQFDSWGNASRLDSLFEQMAIETGGAGLMFKPVNYSNYLDFIDPFPMVTALADYPAKFPAVVFWSGLEAIALEVDNVSESLKNQMLARLHHGSQDELHKFFREIKAHQKTKRILHISDLHFGKPEASRRRQYLKKSLQGICKDIDRVVVTGDLFDDPTRELKQEFDEFRDDVERFTEKPLVLIPGNHDVRKSGNKFGSWGENYKNIAEYWKPVVIDHDLEVAFLCFDSCEEGSFARGGVSEEQRLSLATKFDNQILGLKKIGGYTRIALVHHHPLPFSSEPEPTTLYQKCVQKFFSPDKFVAFDNAEEFNRWCVDRDISLILHGHKHFPRQTSITGGPLVIGCGSTTGVEQTPMSYDIVTLNEFSQHWSVSFFHDEFGDGGGFKRQSITLDAG